MKSDVRYKIVRLYHLVVACLVMFLIFSPQAWASEGCVKMTIEATVHAVTLNPMCQDTGPALLTIGGRSFPVTLLSTPGRAHNLRGQQHPHGDEELDFLSGTASMFEY